VTRKPVTNLPQSIHRRLLNRARESGRTFNELLQHYALERFLYRLSRSRYKTSLILKGALSFARNTDEFSRPTRDIDFLGKTANTIENIENIIRQICTEKVEPDGLTFDPDTVQGQVIVEDTDYSGVRTSFIGHLGNAKIFMQVDISFGDEVTPRPEKFDYPVILENLPQPTILRYTPESVIAEKLEAMVKLGEINSRIRDFYDIWYLSRNFSFDGELLSSAVLNTFQTRETQIIAKPVALTTTFSENPEKQTAYRAFMNRSIISNAPENLRELVQLIAEFILPILEALDSSRSFKGRWKPGGPWSSSE